MAVDFFGQFVLIITTIELLQNTCVYCIGSMS